MFIKEHESTGLEGRCSRGNNLVIEQCSRTDAQLSFLFWTAS